MRLPLCVAVLLSVICFSFQCEDGWRQSAYDANKCYFIGITKKIWFDAELSCQAAAPNAHLTSVVSAYELNNIAAITNETLNDSSCDNMWIGGNDFDQSGQFVWTDGRPFSYRYWAPGQPIPINHCVSWQARLNSQWKTENCGTTNCFICEQYNEVTSVLSTTTTPTTASLYAYPCLRDIAVAIDYSTAIGSMANARLETEFIGNNLTEHWTLAQNNVQIAAIFFQDVIPIDELPMIYQYDIINFRSIMNAVVSQWPIMGTPNLTSLLTTYGQKYLTPAGGQGARNNVQKSLIILSASATSADVTAAAAVARTFQNVAIVTVGLSPVTAADLQPISSGPGFAFSSTLINLSSLVQQLAIAACMQRL